MNPNEASSRWSGFSRPGRDHDFGARRSQSPRSVSRLVGMWLVWLGRADTAYRERFFRKTAEPPIGRASCRGKEWISGGAGLVKKKKWGCQVAAGLKRQ